MNAKEIIEVLGAFERGERIECSLKGKNLWELVENPVWDFVFFDYRSKPEIIYVNVYADSKFVHNSEKRAIEAGNSRILQRTAKFIEVTPRVEECLKEKGLI